MTKSEYRKNAYYLLYLVKCVLNNRVPDNDILKQIDLEQLYYVSSAHSLASIVAYALESAGIYSERFKQAKAKAIRKTIILDSERNAIISEFKKKE